jgi:hypothetical protein
MYTIIYRRIPYITIPRKTFVPTIKVQVVYEEVLSGLSFIKTCDVFYPQAETTPLGIVVSQIYVS